MLGNCSNWDLSSRVSFNDLFILLKDKWPCTKCNRKNLPIHRNCDRCWSVRDGWLPDKKTATPEFTENVKQQLSTEVHQEGLYSSSDNESARYYYHSKGVDNDSTKPAISNYSVSMFRPIIDIPQLNPKLTKTVSVSNRDINQFANDQHAQHSYPPNLQTYPSASSSGSCHTYTPTADNPMLTDDIATETGSSQLTCSQDSGLHDCSLKDSFDESFDLQQIEHTELSQIEDCLEQSKPSSLARGHTIPVSEVISPASLPSLLRKDSGIGSSISLETPTEERLQCFNNVHSLPKCSSSNSSKVHSQPKCSSSNSGKVHSQPKCSSSNSSSSGKRKRLKSSNSTSAKQDSSGNSETTALCSICLNAPKNAVLVHGHTGHQISCYRCAKRLYRRGKPCPVCRRRIQKVIRNFLV